MNDETLKHIFKETKIFINKSNDIDHIVKILHHILEYYQSIKNDSLLQNTKELLINEINKITKENMEE